MIDNIDYIKNLGKFERGDVLVMKLKGEVQGNEYDIAKELSEIYGVFTIIEPKDCTSDIHHMSREEFIQIGKAMGLVCQEADPAKWVR